tara:strand:+ start:154 stop:1017 length:864 start_codon:yes stop_codon:yes gene_type:complete
MNSLEISSIGSACGKNRYEPTNKIVLLLLCRQYKDIYKKLMFDKGIFTFIDPLKKTYDKKLEIIYSEYKQGISNPEDFEELQVNIKKRLKRENKDIKEDDLKYATSFLENSMKKDCGSNNETGVINKMNYKKGNNRMYYYSENGWSIRGLHDATCGDIVIEIKTRMKHQNVRKNEYDLYQLFGYLLAMSETRGKIVQKYNSDIYDSDIETEREYGLIDIKTGIWKQKFEKFKTDLNNFFIQINKYTEHTFDPYSIIDPKETPIASFDIDGIPHNVNPKYEKIVKALT